MVRPDGADSDDVRRRLVWICLEGLDRAQEIRRTLGDAGFAVRVARTGRHLAARREVDDAVVLILSDAVPGWLRIVHELHRSRPSLRILLVSDLEDHLELVTALNAGVDGIGRPDDLPEAVHASVVGLCEESVSLPRALVRHLVDEVRAGRGQSVRSPTGDVQLTDREWQILQLMIQKMTTREMAAELFVAEGTVRSHVSALLGKLGVRSRDEAVALAERG